MVFYVEKFLKNVLDWVGNLVSIVVCVIVVIIMVFFILFYFLRDSCKMKNGFLMVLLIKLC